MDNKNQNNAPEPAPDYSFILNQAAPEPKPKKSKKMMVLLIVAGVLVVATIALYLFTPRKEPVQQQTKIAPVGAPTAEAVSATFISSIQANQPEQAYKMFSLSFQDRQSLKVFTDTIATVMMNNVNLSECKPAPVNVAQNVQEVTCPMQNGKASITYTFTTEQADGKVTIKDLSWKFDKPLALTDIK